MTFPTHRPTRRHLVALGAAYATAMLLPAHTMAQGHAAWPTRPVTLVVPFTAGGTTDIIARVIGQRLGELWGQSVVIDNRAGAGGGVGAQLTAKAPADGYTMMLASGSMYTVNPHIYAKLPYAAKDFAYITGVAGGPMLVVVNPALPVKTLAELVAYAKANPGKLNMGSAGTGSQVHMAGEALADAAGIDLVHVPYKGESLGYTDLIAGQVQVMVGNIAAASQFVKSGKLRALAVTGKERSPMLPDVPTATEAGVPGLDSVSGWFGFVMPAGTPGAVVHKVQVDTLKVLADPATREQLAKQGMQPIGNTPQQMLAAIESESKRWEQVVKNRNIRAN